MMKIRLALLVLVILCAASSAQTPYANSRSPHGPLNLPCQNCHTAMGWKPIRSKPEFDHNKTKFPLRGLHESVTCTQCHIKPVFSNTGTRCADCHADIHKRQLGPNCEQCHTVKGWKVEARAIEQHQNRFPLLGAHAAVDCAACHKNEAVSAYKTMSTDCYSCHANEFRNTSNPNHVAGKFSTSCGTCHGFDNWFNANFDHSSVGFPLTGAHSVPPRQCADCHVNNNYNITTTACVSCHLKDYQGASNPNHVQLGFAQTCDSCHTTSAWQPAQFDHSKSGFPLTGMHTVPPRQCADCHVNNNYNITNTTCVSCHLKDWQGTNNPNHAQQNIPQTCEVCHSTSGWSPANFDHSKTGFPLTGLHTVPPRQCSDCHVNNNYNITNTTCVSCHLKDWQGTNNPNHAQQNIPQTCELCHVTSGWSPANFDHSKTGFPLTGLHTVPPRQCTDCHVNNNYNITNTTCVSCHLKDWQNTNNPNHAQQNIPQTCELCHVTSGWSPANFDHSKTGFPLTGLHTVPPRQCTDCHINNNYNITNTACVSCHQNDYNNAKSPVDHVGAHFPTTCEQCHDTSNWMDGKFDHSQTGWALTGLHTVPPRACTDCHVNGNYNITNTACVSCHQNDYNNAKSPVDHVAAHFPTTCEQCHDTSNWMDGKFDHSQTGWALTGLHTVPPRACTDCHINGNYNITNTACVSCHQNDYNNAKSPVDHIAAKFPTTCELCHDTTNWMDGKFDHSQTGWTLTGMHTVPPRACTDCHVNNNYNITNTSCVSCHQNDYNNAKTPVDHVTAKFPTNCEMCHDTTNWMDGKFDHSQTGWALTGMHTVPPRACTDCHVNNNYNITNTDCYSCHATDYKNTNNPNHIAAHFPTTCQTCHDTSTWLDAKFNHTWFDLNHGNANGVCATCHTNPNDYSVFQCTNCHLKAQTDQIHQGINGYVYNSINCYQCHKNGGGG